MPANIVVVESDRQISQLAQTFGVAIAAVVPLAELATAARTVAIPDLFVIDIRGTATLPPDVAELRRRVPSASVVLVASKLEPALLLDAMRAGVSEVVPEPVTADGLRAAIDRIIGQQISSTASGNVLAFVGAKGGVGATTLAVNVAAAVAAGEDQAATIMIDLHVTAHGDAGLLLGVEPRFSTVDALDNVHRLDATYLKSLVARTKDGLDVIASPERPSLRAPDGSQIRTLLRQVAQNYQVVVLDVPRTDFGILDSLEPVTRVTLVVNQELPTVRRAAQVANILRQRYGKECVGAVVTRYDARADIVQEDIERVVGLPVWAVLPSDYRNVIAAANAGKPVVLDQGRLSVAIQQLATRLTGRKMRSETKGKSTGRMGGFF